MDSLFGPTGDGAVAPVVRPREAASAQGAGRERAIARRDAARSADERRAVALMTGSWIRIERNQYGLAAGVWTKVVVVFMARPGK